MPDRQKPNYSPEELKEVEQLGEMVARAAKKGVILNASTPAMDRERAKMSRPMTEEEKQSFKKMQEEALSKKIPKT